MIVVSVIVPVYNVGEYLDKCIGDLLGQSYKNIEIILVDDGSDDNSGKLCDLYRCCYRNIKVVHKKNGGVSSARNVGLNNATGEYVFFMDPDDRLDEKAIETLLRGMLDNNCDVGLMGIEGKGGVNHVPIINSVFSIQQIMHDIIKGRWLESICSRLIKMTVIKGLNFDTNLAMGEDLLFFWKTLLRSNMIYVDETSYYHIITRFGSATNSPYTLKQLGDITASRLIWNDCKLLKLYNCEDVAFNKYFNTLLARTIQLSANDNGEYINEYSVLRSEIKMAIMNVKYYKKSIRNIILAVIIVLVPYKILRPIFRFLWFEIVV